MIELRERYVAQFSSMERVVKNLRDTRDYIKTLQTLCEQPEKIKLKVSKISLPKNYMPSNTETVFQTIL